MYRLVFFTLLGIVSMFGAAHVVFSFAIPSDEGAAQMAPLAATDAAASASGGEIVIRRDGSGQFYLGAQANGHDTTFLIDTGADFVALSPEDAEGLDVEFDRSNFEPITQTASGIGYGQKVTIGHLAVADREFRDVEAVVIDGLETNLLGQSLLSKLGRIEMHGDEIVISDPV